LPETMPRFDRIVVDDLEQERNMTKPMVDPALVVGDLRGLVCGDFAGRQDAGETTAFVFRGLAVGDLAVAGVVYMRAQAAGVVGT
ncbi:ornithine cyclodeaminase family protein, partial [Mesorhizobium sp. M2E.F.Ca.ET.209.01.1.1]